MQYSGVCQWLFNLQRGGCVGLLMMMAGCGGGGGSAGMPAPSGPLALTVTGGVGPATVAAMGQAELWATVQPQSEIVTKWSGGTFSSDDEEWHVTLAAGTTPPVITAQRQTMAITFETQIYRAPTAVAKTARFYIPTAPIGLILFLHGTGGSSQFIEKTESRYLALKAISKGYAVLAPEAEESQAGDLDGDGKLRWNVALDPANIDLKAIDSLLASIYTSGRLRAGLPQYVLGMSNGGSMAVALGAVAGTASGPSLFPRLQFKAAISYCAQARNDAVNNTRTPTAWLLCGNDDNAEVSNVNAQANSTALAGRGVPTQVMLHAATPLYDERFVRVAGVSTAQSRTLAAEFRGAGMVDASGLFNMASGDIATRVVAAPAGFPTLAGLLPAQQKEVISQISVMRAEHEMYADWTSRSLRWFATYP